MKIDIGAVFNIEPKNSKKNELVAFQALERELIFDIDLTDYDDIRSCCDGANICNKCWKFMIIAVKILDRALRNDFGFKHLLFVYSGRRGIHCWVSDRRARELTFEARSAIVEYLTLVVGGDFKNKKVNFNRKQNLHPSITYAIFVIEQYFPALLNDQGWLDSKEKFDQLIELCSVNHFKPELKKIYDSKLKSSDLWSKIEAKTRQLTQNSNVNSFFLEEVKIQYAYPRLDINVSKGIYSFR
jgi:DNA primase small subunit